MSALTLERLTALLLDFVRQTGAPLDLLLIKRLALYAYGAEQAKTEDLDAELAGNFEQFSAFLKTHGIPANLSENTSGWSVVAMPPGYRDRATMFLERDKLRIRLVAPVDFVIAKLRRGTEQDLADAEFVVRRFHISADAVRASAEQAIAASPKDTALFVFRKTVELFRQRIAAL